MVEESPPTPGTAAAPGRRPVPGGGTRGDTGGEPPTPVTEKPLAVSATAKPSQYVFTVNDATGAVLKIERVDPESGEKRELTAKEYGYACAYASLVAPYYTGLASLAPSQDTEMNSMVKAYYEAIQAYLGVAPR